MSDGERSDHSDAWYAGVPVCSIMLVKWCYLYGTLVMQFCAMFAIHIHESSRLNISL